MKSMRRSARTVMFQPPTIDNARTRDLVKKIVERSASKEPLAFPQDLPKPFPKGEEIKPPKDGCDRADRED